MKIATKLGLLFAGMIIVFVLLGVTLLAQMKTVSNGYDALLASPVHDINAARVVQVNFKKEVQEWKDTLLRGHNPEDLAKYSKQFHERKPQFATAPSHWPRRYRTRKRTFFWSGSSPPTT